jgi:xanthine dehydrogenase/oxidase
MLMPQPGQLFTRGPGAYKIPAFNDVPVDLRVTLMKDVENPFTVHSSKAIGEPPFFLASSVFFALKEAIYAFRTQEGLHGFFPLYSPLTSERVRMACVDKFTRPFIEAAAPDGRYQCKGSW